MNVKTNLILLLLILGAFSISAKAQSGYGYSSLQSYQVPDGQQRLYAETGTILDYNFAYYYDPGIEGIIYKNSYIYAQNSRELAPGYSGIIRYLRV